MPPRHKPGIVVRENADGTKTYQIRWRQGGGRSGRNFSHSFDREKLAVEARNRILGAGGVCHCPKHAPEGSTPSKHYGPGEKQAPTFADYAREHIGLRTGIGVGQRNALLRDLDRHMAPFFTDLAVDGRTALAWLRGLEDGSHPWLGGRPLAPRTRRRLITQAGAVLNAALREGLVDANPFQGIRIGREDHDRQEEQVILTHEEWSLLRGEIRQDVGRGVADLLIGTGARWGEVTALLVSHVDRRKSAVRITQSWQPDGKGGAALGPTKSRKSRRTVEIGRKTLDAIEPFLDGRNATDLLFCARNGERLRAYNYWRDVWTPAVTRAQGKGLAKSPRIHDLRHSHVSWLIAAGVPIAVIQRRLGHDSITTTIDTYGHMLPSAERAATDAIDEALG